MLTSIQIRDFAIIDHIELELAAGMSALTGETGAGKSILVDALLFVAGGRVGTDVIRHGADKTEVTATFTLTELQAEHVSVQQWYRDQDIDFDREVILRRLLGSDGRSRAWVNGQSMPIQALRDLAALLVDVHGQMEYQSLMKRQAQRELLDQHGGHATLLAQVGRTFAALKALRQERDDMMRSAQDRNERLALLRFQLSELDALAPSADEYAHLASERQRHTHSGKLAQGATELAALLREAHDSNAEQLLARAVQLAKPLSQLDAQLQPTVVLLDEALIACREAANAIDHYQSVLDADPQRQEWVENRLAALESAARKHRVEVEALSAVQRQLHDDVARLENLEFTIETLSGQLQQAEQHFAGDCQALRQAREVTAKALGQRITVLMQSLGMPGGRFAVELVPLTDAQANSQGSEEIEFMVSANPGQPLKPLAKVASGGELSRISLSVQVAAVESVPVPTLVFDEVDAGVGGAVAEMVGRQLKALSARAQVLCVTHLPQVAAQAQQQIRVAKLTDGTHTRTSLEVLSPSARVEEIARMLGGTTISDMARSHAREMLTAATQTQDTPVIPAPNKHTRKATRAK